MRPTRSVACRSLSVGVLVASLAGCGHQSAASRGPDDPATGSTVIGSSTTSTEGTSGINSTSGATPGAGPTTTIDPAVSVPPGDGGGTGVPTNLAGEGAIPMSPVPTADPIWLANNVPQAGSVFGNLKNDASLDGLGPVVALTFDDGPTRWTPWITQVLKANLVPATFFQITNQTGARAALDRQMVADGFRIGSHSRSHAHLPTLQPLQQYDEINGGADALDAILGAGSTKCIRPPYGQMDLLTIDTIAKRNLAAALWNVDSEDWKQPGIPAIVNRVLATVHDRSVILMHDGGGDRSQTVGALQWLIPALRARGYTFVAVC